jgi:hypothetical protein
MWKFQPASVANSPYRLTVCPERPYQQRPPAKPNPFLDPRKSVKVHGESFSVCTIHVGLTILTNRRKFELTFATCHCQPATANQKRQI